MTNSMIWNTGAGTGTVGPKGDKGDTGLTGLTGPVGPVGPSGAGGSANTVGGYASRPSAGTAGNVYQCSDYPTLSWIDNGTSWDLLRPVYVPNAHKVNISGWTASNTGSETYKDVNGVLSVEGIPSMTGAWALHYHTKPSAPFTLNMIVRPNISDTTAVFAVGLRESSSGKLIDLGVYCNNTIGVPGLLVHGAHWTNVTTFSSAYVADHGIVGCDPIWLKFQDDNTNWKAYVSNDGVNYILFASETRNTFLTADQAWIGVYKNDTALVPSSMQVLAYWEA